MIFHEALSCIIASTQYLNANPTSLPNLVEVVATSTKFGRGSELFLCPTAQMRPFSGLDIGTIKFYTPDLRHKNTFMGYVSRKMSFQYTYYHLKILWGGGWNAILTVHVRPMLGGTDGTDHVTHKNIGKKSARSSLFFSRNLQTDGWSRRQYTGDEMPLLQVCINNMCASIAPNSNWMLLFDGFPR